MLPAVGDRALRLLLASEFGTNLLVDLVVWFVDVFFAPVRGSGGLRGFELVDASDSRAAEQSPGIPRFRCSNRSVTHSTPFGGSGRLGHVAACREKYCRTLIGRSINKARVLYEAGPETLHRVWAYVRWVGPKGWPKNETLLLATFSQLLFSNEPDVCNNDKPGRLDILGR